MLVVAASPRLRSALARWIRADPAVQVVAAVPGSSDVTEAHRFSDLVIASGLGSQRELREIRDRVGRGEGLVALTLRNEPVPPGWTRVGPGTGRAAVLGHARRRARARLPRGRGAQAGQRSLVRTAIVMASGSLLALVAAAVAAAFYTDPTGASWQRAALVFAERFPDAEDAWWHSWGVGAPLLADPGWPALRLAAGLTDPTLAFRSLAAFGASLCSIAVALLARRLGSPRTVAALAGATALALPGLWTWARGNDALSLIGLAGALLAASASRAGVWRIALVALSIGLSSVGGFVWLAVAALAALGGTRTARSDSLAGVALGWLLSSILTLPPLVLRGDLAGAPPLARAPALSDVVPAAVCVLTLGAVWALRQRGAIRPLGAALAVIGLAGSSALALAVPRDAVDQPLAAVSPFTRVAASTGRSLRLQATDPTLSATADALDPRALRGEVSLREQAADLEWLAVDRALAPDEASAGRYIGRGWQAVDRARQLFGMPAPRPILTAGLTTTLLVVARPDDLRLVSAALIALGSSSDLLIPVGTSLPLEAIDTATLETFTAVFVYGAAFDNRGAAARVLDGYVESGGIVVVDVAGSAAAGPLATAVEPVAEPPGPFVSRGDVASLGSDRPLASGPPLVSIARPTWEQASLSVGERRVIVVGEKGPGKGRVVWSGADLPRRAAAGDPVSQDDLATLLRWAIGTAAVATGPWPAPAGNEYPFPGGTATFLAPGHWRIDITQAATGVLFKEAMHRFWTAYQVESRSRIPLTIWPTAHGLMYVPLPTSARRVEFVFETPLRDLGRGLSALAILGIAVGTFLRRRDG